MMAVHDEDEAVESGVRFVEDLLVGGVAACAFWIGTKKNSRHADGIGGPTEVTLHPLAAATFQ